MMQHTTYAAVVGHSIRQLREQEGLDQEAMAKGLSITQPSWSRIERGDVAISIEQLSKIAAILRTTPSAIVAQADNAAEALLKLDVQVESDRSNARGTSGGDIIVAAALGAIIAFALSRS